MLTVDSNGLISLLIETDQNHKKALATGKKFLYRSDTLIIPEDVFSETINILGKKFGHQKAFAAGNFINDSKIFSVENTTEKIRLDALVKFKNQTQSVSFTDCIVMAFADFLNTKDIFGFDKVFPKNGYKLV